MAYIITRKHIKRDLIICQVLAKDIDHGAIYDTSGQMFLCLMEWNSIRPQNMPQIMTLVME